MKDILGRPTVIGDTVLTTSYYTTEMDVIGVIIKVNKTTVLVQCNTEWHVCKNGQYILSNTLKRTSSKIVIITDQMVSNRATYPEICL